jgi:two-component system, LuxR family, response regulator FixJ
MTEGQDIILVVDDDLAVRESLKFALELEGLAVRAFGSGRELLEHPDLPRARCLVLDYRMPVMDGFEVLDRLADRQVRLPVILITSDATGAIRHRAAICGVQHVLEKPLSDSTLVENIQDILGHQR